MRRKGINNTSTARAVLNKLGYDYVQHGNKLVVDTPDWKTLKEIIKEQSA